MTQERFKGSDSIIATTLDDLLRLAIDAIQTRGRAIHPSKGAAKEIVGALLILTNPRARFSVTETRGRLFSALGELLWYLSGSNSLAQIEYYIPKYREFAENGILHGAYGPRFFGTHTEASALGGSRRFLVDQVRQVIKILTDKPFSRQAVVQVFDVDDLTEPHKDVPCTCSMQFMIRDDSLQLVTSMRSNDVYVGLPHDVFAFTMLQEIVARTLRVEVGAYRHFVGSLHLYLANVTAAAAFLAEGWQPTDTMMPAVPIGDPWPSIRVVLEAEERLRLDGPTVVLPTADLDTYWADIIRLLQIYALVRDRSPVAREVFERMSTNAYDVFIEAKLADL